MRQPHTSQLAGITSSSHPEHGGDAGTLALGIFYKGSLVVLTGPRRANRFRTSAPAFSGAIIWPTGRRMKHNASSACSVAVGQVCSKLVGRKPASRFKAKRSASITNQHIRAERSWLELPCLWPYVWAMPVLCGSFASAWSHAMARRSAPAYSFRVAAGGRCYGADRHAFRFRVADGYHAIMATAVLPTGRPVQAHHASVVFVFFGF